MIMIDIDQLLDCTKDLAIDINDFPVIKIEIDHILETTCDW